MCVCVCVCVCVYVCVFACVCLFRESIKPTLKNYVFSCNTVIADSFDMHILLSAYHVSLVR